MRTAVVTRSGPDLVPHVADVTSERDRDQLARAVEEWHRLLDVNLIGVVNGLRAFVPRLLAVAEQAALAGADSPISVTVLCPALVKSGIPEVGDEPADAIDAPREGCFLVMPAEWGGATREHAHRFVTGDQPVMSSPGDVA